MFQLKQHAVRLLSFALMSKNNFQLISSDSKNWAEEVSSFLELQNFTLQFVWIKSSERKIWD